MNKIKCYSKYFQKWLTKIPENHTFFNRPPILDNSCGMSWPVV